MNSRIVVALAIALQLAATHDAAAQAAAASKPAAPSKAVGAAVVAQEQAMLDAIANKDTVAFNKALGSDFVYVDGRGAMRWQMSKTSTILPACVLGTGWSLDNPMTTEVGTDLVVLTYSSSGKAVCNGRAAALAGERDECLAEAWRALGRGRAQPDTGRAEREEAVAEP